MRYVAGMNPLNPVLLLYVCVKKPDGRSEIQTLRLSSVDLVITPEVAQAVAEAVKATLARALEKETGRPVAVAHEYRKAQGPSTSSLYR